MVETTTKGLRIAAPNIAAARIGVHEGMAHADAKAVAPDLITHPIDRRADAKALKRLALWAQRYSPWTRPDGRDGVVIDITGCAALFGGEIPLASDVYARLNDANITCVIGIGDTVGAARALARFSPTHEAPLGYPTSLDEASAICAAPAGLGVTALKDLPVEALGLSGEATQLLRRVGLRTIGAVADAPRSALMRRFSAVDVDYNVLARLDEMAGERKTPFNATAAPPNYAARLAFTEPLQTHEALMAALDHVLSALAEQLLTAGRGARRLVLQICRCDGGVARVTAAASRANADTAHWRRLLSERMGAIDLGFGADAVVLEAPSTARFDALADAPKLTPHAHDEAAVRQLADRLMARFGDDAVRRAQTCESWLPERAERLEPILKARASSSASALASPKADHAPRPVRLLDHPEEARVVAALPDGPPAQFTWRRVTRRVTRADGPERIAPEWWRQLNAPVPARTRDYYRVETEDGHRFWLFREGLYETAQPHHPPVWRVHGVFA